MKVKYTDGKMNQQVLKMVEEKRSLMHSINKRRHCWKQMVGVAIRMLQYTF